MKLKVLFLTPRLPYPATSGGILKTNKMVEYLSSQYRLSLGCLLKENDSDFIKSYLASIKLEQSYFEVLNRPRSIKSFLISLLINIPLSIYRNTSSSFKKSIAKLAVDKDVIFIDHFLMFQYIPQDFKGKIVLHEHNTEYLIWSRFADTQSNFFKKMLIKFESRRIFNYEKKIINVSNIVLAAPNDIINLEKLSRSNASTRFIETLHLGDDTLLNAPSLKYENTEKTILYIGTLSWEANRDGLLWFLNEVWPLLKNRHPDLKFQIIGRLDDKSIFEKWLNDIDIEWLGFVDDLLPFYQSARVFIAPLRFGSGIKVKVVSALYAGLPLVTTSIGVEGLDVIDDKHVFIADSQYEQANKIELLLIDKEKWISMSNMSRQLANEKYTWNFVFDNLKKAIE